MIDISTKKILLLLHDALLDDSQTLTIKVVPINSLIAVEEAESQTFEVVE
jgi:hypothetical protein